MQHAMFPAILLACILAAGCSQPYEPKPVNFTPVEIPWAEGPAMLPEGARMAVLEGDPTKPGFYTVRIKFPDGYQVQPHHLERPAHITIISGRAKVGVGDEFNSKEAQVMGAGGYATVTPQVHNFVLIEEESVVQFQGFGPMNFVYIHAEDDPRHSMQPGMAEHPMPAPTTRAADAP